jgi:hypothetical protein
MLVAFASMIREMAAALGLERLLFSSRDGLYLKQVFDATSHALGRNAPETVYWHSSRIARVSGGRTYLDYCRSLLGRRAALIDLCGTGASLLRLCADLGAETPKPAIVLCELVDSPALMKAYADAFGARAEQGLELRYIVSTRSFLNNDFLEMMNYVPQGMVVRVEHLAGNFLPVREPLEFHGPERAIVEQTYRLATEASAGLRGSFSAAAHDEVRTRGADLIPLLHDLAAMVQPELVELLGTFQAAHGSLERATRHRLGMP